MSTYLKLPNSELLFWALISAAFSTSFIISLMNLEPKIATGKMDTVVFTVLKVLLPKLLTDERNDKW
jgi:hypothetical protein